MKAYYQIKDPSFPVKAEISLEEYYDKLKEEGFKLNDIYISNKFAGYTRQYLPAIYPSPQNCNIKPIPLGDINFIFLWFGHVKFDKQTICLGRKDQIGDIVPL